MRLRDVDNEERDPISVLLVEFVESGNLPPEWRSGVTAEDENYGATLRREAGQPDRSGLAEFRQGEVWGCITEVQCASTGLRPERFKGEQEKWDWAGQFRHEPGKGLRGLAHDVVERAAAQQPYHSDDGEGPDQYAF
jgi:hypothetical protein